MSGLLRRVRGAIGMGLTWAIGWGVVTLVIGVPGGIGPGLVMRGAANGVVGFIAGCSFFSILSVAERGKKIEDLSVWRVAIWGGLGSLALAGIVGAAAGIPGGVVWQAVVLTALLGAGSASGTLAMARRGTPALTGGDDPKLLDGM